MGKLVDKPFVTSLDELNSLFVNAGGVSRQITLENFRRALNINDTEVLNEIAFYVDINKPSASGSTRVDVGGNLHMLSTWLNLGISCIMDANGNYARLNRNDSNYVVEGEKITDANGQLTSSYAHGDLMKIIPETYCRVQLIEVNSVTVERCWFSPIPIPGGARIPQLVVGKIKASVRDGRLRSVPGVSVAGNNTIKQYWDKAQLRSKNHGLAGPDYQRWLLVYLMSKYGQRDIQNTKGDDNTLVFGCGLDGSENTTGSQMEGYQLQCPIKPGAALSLGDYDGKVAVTDAAGGVAHSVNVGGFIDVFAHHFEMRQGMCTVGGDRVILWRGNFMPLSNAPQESDFAGVEHIVVPTSTRTTDPKPTGFNIISSEEGHGVWPVPKEPISGISYNDGWNYASAGQLWMFGGLAGQGGLCGLAFASAACEWTYSQTYRSTRLAYYGSINEVSAQRFKELA